MKFLIVLHRYAGVAAGVLMTLWCLSGFVMMYQSFPELTQAERLRGLELITAPAAAALAAVPLEAETRVADARIEMAAGAPVLRVNVQDSGPVLYDLRDGQPRAEFNAVECLRIAGEYGRGAGIASPPRAMGVIDHDQWTVANASQRPIHHFAFDDRLGTEIYVSGATGEVFQQTLRRERILSWFGAVPHWLYPSLLRANVQAWSQVVIWTSVLGVFLTATGMIVGLIKIGSRRAGTISPYRGFWFWHHMTGLVFGVLTLTWVFSGLLTMGPWGLLDSDTTQVREQFRGDAAWGDTRAALAAARPQGAVRVTATPLAGELRLLAVSAAGRAERLAAGGTALALTGPELRQALTRAGLLVSDIRLIQQEDAYYYGHHGEVELPVYRVILADAERTRLYVSAQSGQLLRAVDAQARQSRWLQSALHDFDWPVVRSRPVWDFVVLPLLLGVTLATALGTWLGFQRIRRDLRRIRAYRFNHPV